MKNLWVLDAKCKVLRESSLPQDGSAYYYGRTVVPVSSKEQAIEQLTQVLDDDHIKVEEVLNAVRADEGDWLEDDDFEVHDSIETAEATNAIGIRVQTKNWACPGITNTSHLGLRRMINLVGMI